MKTHGKLKWLMSVILAFAVAFSTLPFSVLAANESTTYKQVASLDEVTSGGNFVITAESEGKYYALGTDISGKISGSEVSVSEGVVSGSSLPVWTVSATSAGVSLSNGTSYLSYSSSTNFKSDTAAYEWTVSSETSGLFRLIAASTASASTVRALMFQIEAVRFGAYAISNSTGYVADLTLFKASDSSTDTPVGTDITNLTPSAAYTGDLTVGTDVTFSCGTITNATFETSTDQTSWTALSGNTLTIPEGEPGEYTVYVRAALDGKYSQTYALSYTLASNEKVAVKVDSISDGDKIYFYNADSASVISSTANGKKLQGSAASVTDDTFAVKSDMAEFAVTVDDNGYYTFTSADGKYLTSGETGNSLSLADAASDYSLWTLETADGGYFIKNVNAAYSGKSQYIEYYNGFTVYGMNDSKAPIYTFQFYMVDDGAFKDGDYVIWAPAYNMALSSTYGGYYNNGVAVTVDGDSLTGYGSTEVWNVAANDDGTYSISYDGQKLGMAASYSSITLGAENDKWLLEDAGDGCYYVKNTVRECYIEWYSSKSYWSGYKYINVGSEGMFALKFTKPEAKSGYSYDSSVTETVAQWGGGGPYDSTENATVINGDKYEVGDMKDTSAKYTVIAKGAQAQPYQTSTSTTTGGTNYYMGGANIGASEGDYMQFAVSTLGYGDMALSFRLRATNAGPGSLKLQYSADNGNSFNDFSKGEYSYAYTKYTSDGTTQVSDSGEITDGVAKTSKAPTYYVSFMFYVPAGAENVENLLIRLVPGTERADGKTGAVSGNIRIDSVALTGSPVVDSSITGYVAVDPDGKEEDQAAGTELTMTTETEGAAILYRFVDADGNGEWNTYDSTNKPVLPETLPAVLEVKATSEGKQDSITRIFKYSAGTVASVKMSPNGGGVFIKDETSEVTLSCETEGATIYYAIGASEEYQEYTAPIILEKGFEKLVVKAYASKAGFKDSSVVTRTFTERSSDTYNIYFGQLHSHTSYSDGAGTAEEAFNHASNVENLDFLAVTDHSNSFDNADSASISDGSMSAEWKEGHELADKYTTDDFVGLFGYEMTWSNGLGHINTYNTPGFQSRTQSQFSTYSTALQNYYAALKTESDSISQFNHPGTTFGDFSDFAYYDEELDQLITIIEVGNGEGAIGSSGYFPSYEYYTRALDKGWHVAPTNNQDNHKGLWGDANTARSVVLADSLARDDIYDAMRNYRVYATEDNDLSITYTLDDNIMGTILAKDDVGETVNLKVALNDPTDSALGKVEVIVNGGLSVASKNVTSNSETVNFSIPSTYSYYYVKITQADGDIAVTAPVWVGEVEAVGISEFSTDAPLPVQNQELNLTLGLYNNEKSPLEIDSVVFTIDDEVIHTADSSKLNVVESLDTATYTFPFTYDGLGKTNINVTVTAKLNGVEKVYKDVLQLSYASPEMVTRVVVDGSHYNDYVSGYYGGNIANLTTIAADKQIEVKVEKEKITAETLAECNLLIISAPARNSGTSNSGDYVASTFEDDFIKVVSDYVKNGGSVIVCGLADYQDKKGESADNQTSVQINKLLAGIGATLTINDDEAYDEVNNGGQMYRLYPETFNTATKWANGIVEGQKYSQYSGCTVNVSDAVANDTVKAAEWIVKGFDTTYSIDSDGDGKGGVEKGDAVFLASQETVYGGTIFAAGGVFVSDFEVKAELDNIWDLPYANRTIVENILEDVMVELPVTPIAEMRKGNLKDVFRIQGYTTSSRIEGNAFFDAIYLQDETGGTTVFPIAEEGLEIGTKMDIIGYVDEYQGDREIQIMSYKILDEPKKVYEPTLMSNKDAMDYENNGGKLIQVQGIVQSGVEYSTDGTGVAQFEVMDANGDLAKVFIDGYILSSTTGVNSLASIVKEGAEVSAVGLLYCHPEGSSDVSVPVLRVRDCDEIKLISNSTFILGDLNDDGAVDVDDVSYLQRIIAKFYPAEEYLTVGDVNGDGKLNVDDVTIIQRYLAKFGSFEDLAK